MHLENLVALATPSGQTVSAMPSARPRGDRPQHASARPIAVIAVHRGQLDFAREHSARALRLASEQFADGLLRFVGPV